MRSVEGQVALVTGSSRGIGAATTKFFAHTAHELVFTDATRDSLASVSSIIVFSYLKAFTARQLNVRQVERRAKVEEQCPVDTLVAHPRRSNRWLVAVLLHHEPTRAVVARIGPRLSAIKSSHPGRSNMPRNFVRVSGARRPAGVTGSLCHRNCDRAAHAECRPSPRIRVTHRPECDRDRAQSRRSMRTSVPAIRSG